MTGPFAAFFAALLTAFFAGLLDVFLAGFCAVFCTAFVTVFGAGLACFFAAAFAEPPALPLSRLAMADPNSAGDRTVSAFRRRHGTLTITWPNARDTKSKITTIPNGPVLRARPPADPGMSPNLA